jgi:hypothetical protein
MHRTIEQYIDFGIQMLRITYPNQNSYAEDDIVYIISQLLLLGLDSANTEQVTKGIMTKVWIRMEQGTELVNKTTHKKWLGEKRANINFYYWTRYKKLLLEDKLWSPAVVNTLDVVSDTLIELIGDPSMEGKWDRKGLLLGDVQSGKTSNYLAICNKAADVGYKIIILLTGTLENLRKQTQERVDEGFTGRNSRDFLKSNPEAKYVGVGFKNVETKRCAIPFTSIDYDFNKSLLDSLHLGVQDLKEPVILVVKKNKSVLNNLENWLSKWCTNGLNGAKIEYPILLIDDESDNASVNTSEKSITAINEGIRKILDLFTRSSYLGVTATPFANIFIDPFEKDDEFPDLFPKDYIYALSAPTNYIGSSDLFGDDAKYTNSIYPILDAEDYFPMGHKKSTKVNELPESLKEAIIYFGLSNVVRDKRNNTNKHRTMLINVSRFVDVQESVYQAVADYFIEFREHTTNFILMKDSKDPYVQHAKKVFEKFEFEKMEVDWEYTKNNLVKSISPVKIMQVNQKNSYENLDYNAYKDNGLRVITIGGNSLSRGLTLEGLCVSYFYRNSMMYDTLMQMGRWFGYRDNYEDLFRLWLPEIGIEWYEHITRSTNELRDEIKYMQRAGLTPMEFGLKVQAHQDSLLITAKNKMRDTKIIERPVCLEGVQVESYRLRFDKNAIEHNAKISEDFLSKLGAPANLSFPDNVKCWQNVDYRLISDFVSTVYSHPSNIQFDPVFISKYISELTEYPRWDVVLPLGGSGAPVNMAGIPVNSSARNSFVEKDALRISGVHNRVGMPGDAKFGLSRIQQIEAENKYKLVNGEKQSYPSFAYLKVDRNPLLIIYIVDVLNKDINELHKMKSMIGSTPLIVVSASIPSKSDVKKYKTVMYVMNLIDQLNYINYENSDESDDMEGEM